MEYAKAKIGKEKLNLMICKGPFSRIKGLMFAKELKKNEGLLFKFKREAKWPVHMLFVFFPLKIAFIDKRMKVVDVRIAYPFRSFIMPKIKAKYILELNVGFKAKVWDRVKIY